MLKWLRNKLAGPVYVDCYTADPAVYDLARITRASKYLPGWWKHVPLYTTRPVHETFPASAVEFGTMRSCIGFQDLYKTSFCLPMWSEFVISVDPEGSYNFVWRYADGRSDAEVHPEEQRGTFLPANKFQHVKLFSPWMLKCKENVSFLMHDTVWDKPNGDAGVIIPPGILEFKYQASVNINMFVEKLPDVSKTLTISYGTPLVFLTPLTERKVILRYHLVSKEELTTKARPMLSFRNIYKTIVKAKKEQEQCPMRSK